MKYEGWKYKRFFTRLKVKHLDLSRCRGIRGDGAFVLIFANGVLCCACIVILISSSLTTHTSVLYNLSRVSLGPTSHARSGTTDSILLPQLRTQGSRP